MSFDLLNKCYNNLKYLQSYLYTNNTVLIQHNNYCNILPDSLLCPVSGRHKLYSLSLITPNSPYVWYTTLSSSSQIYAAIHFSYTRATPIYQYSYTTPCADENYGKLSWHKGSQSISLCPYCSVLKPQGKYLNLVYVCVQLVVGCEFFVCVTTAVFWNFAAAVARAMSYNYFCSKLQQLLRDIFLLLSLQAR